MDFDDVQQFLHQIGERMKHNDRRSKTKRRLSEFCGNQPSDRCDPDHNTRASNGCGCMNQKHHGPRMDSGIEGRALQVYARQLQESAGQSL